MALVHLDVGVAGDGRAEHVLLAGQLDARETERREQVGRGAFIDARRGIGTVAHELADEQGRVIVARLPQQLDLRGDDVLAAQAATGALGVQVDAVGRQRAWTDTESAPDRHVVRIGRRRLVVGVVALVHVVDRCDAHRQRVTQRHIDGRLEAAVRGAVAVLAEAELGLGAVLAEFGALGGDRDHAARGVLAEQRALGAAVDLDLLRVEQRQELRGDMAQHEIVHQEADGRVLRDEDDVGAGATHAAARGVEACRCGEHETGREVRERADVVDRRAREVRGADRGDRDRHILRRFIALGAGDDDFFECADAALRRGVLRLQLCGAGQRECHGQRERAVWDLVVEFHVEPLS